MCSVYYARQIVVKIPRKLFEQKSVSSEVDVFKLKERRESVMKASATGARICYSKALILSSALKLSKL